MLVFKRSTSNPEFDAPYNTLRRRARLLHVNIKFNGVAQTGSILILNVARRMKLWSKPVAKLGQCRRNSILDVQGIVDVGDLSVTELQRRAANRYEPTPELEFRHVLQSLKLPYTEYDFLDYGSGKGAIVAAATRYPFDRIVGIEFCANLHASAEKNLSKLKDQTAKEVLPVLADAREYAPRPRPLVAYLYNPFHLEIMAPVIDNCAAAAQSADQPSYLLYKNPFYRETLDAHPALEKIWEPFGGSWAVYQFKSTPAP